MRDGMAGSEMITVEKLAGWLKDDGHDGCADDLLDAPGEAKPRVAYEIAAHIEADIARGLDDPAWDLIALLKEWADQSENTAELMRAESAARRERALQAQGKAAFEYWREHIGYGTMTPDYAKWSAMVEYASDAFLNAFCADLEEEK